MKTKIQILGPGCAKCKLLTEHTERAVKDLGLDCELEKVTSLEKIVDFGVMATPALVVDGEVKVSGHVPSSSRLKQILAAGLT